MSEINEIFRFASQGSRALRRALCHRKDSSLLGFHNCFVRSFHRLLECRRHNRYIDCFMLLHNLCKTADGVSISAVAENLISNVKYKIEEFAGLEVTKINIFVEGVRVID